MAASPRRSLIAPYGNHLVDLVAYGDEREALLKEAHELPSIRITTRQLCDLELLATGGFSPLDCFMGQSDYQSVVRSMRLASGVLFPIPITLTVDPAQLCQVGHRITLRDSRNTTLAVMTLEEVFPWDRVAEAELVYGTTDPLHPLVTEMASWGSLCVSGQLRVLHVAHPYDFTELRMTPAEVRERLHSMGAEKVVAFQTRNPLHRAHEELTKRAAESINGTLLLHPSIGMTKPGDIDHFSRVRIYRTLVERYYDAQRTVLSLLPLAMRMAGPREAIWHAIIRRNHGASHFIVGRDHAGPGNDSHGRPFYPPYAAQELVGQHAAEIGITPLFFQEMVYLPDEDRYVEVDKAPPDARTISISGTQVRREYLDKGRPLPNWFTRPETARILADVYPPLYQRGFCVWFTGLSGAGKSTIADVLTVLLLEQGRQATVLDGDIVRAHLSKGLGFSREDRDANILRIGFVASEIVRHHGVVICAAISPYHSTRDQVRAMVGLEHFFEIFVDTPLEICEQRDTKGLYARARRGEITNFTGIDDPYEPPSAPALILQTTQVSPEYNAHLLINLLTECGYVSSTI